MRCMFFISRKSGSIATCTGSTSPSERILNARSRPRNLSFANAYPAMELMTSEIAVTDERDQRAVEQVPPKIQPREQIAVMRERDMTREKVRRISTRLPGGHQRRRQHPHHGQQRDECPNDQQHDTRHELRLASRITPQPRPSLGSAKPRPVVSVHPGCHQSCPSAAGTAAASRSESR